MVINMSKRLSHTPIYISIGKAVCMMVFFLSWFSCKKTVVETAPNFEQFFPLKLGAYQIYQVDSIWYDDFNLDTTYRQFFIKDWCDTLFITSEGKTAMRIERSWRNTLNDSWSSPRAYWAYIENASAVFVVENIPYVVLQFPLKQGSSWNRNRLGFLNEDLFTYKKVFLDSSIAGFYSDSLVVTQSKRSYESIIDKFDFREIYAPNLGLIYHHYVDIDSVYRDKVGSDTNNLPIMSKIKKGLVYKKTLIEFGFE